MHEGLKEALAKRKDKGLAVQIAIGKPPIDEHSKTDMAPGAPEAEDEGKEEAVESTEMDDLQKLSALVKDNPEASALVSKMMGAQSDEMEGEGKEEDMGEIDDTMTSQMSDYDKKDLMQREKPRSLMERAQKGALMRGNK